jgi:hypothetical protein
MCPCDIRHRLGGHICVCIQSTKNASNRFTRNIIRRPLCNPTPCTNKVVANLSCAVLLNVRTIPKHVSPASTIMRFSRRVDQLRHTAGARNDNHATFVACCSIHTPRAVIVHIIMARQGWPCGSHCFCKLCLRPWLQEPATTYAL